MKSKKFIILISILLIIALIIILASSVFTLKTISFNFLNQRNVLAKYTTDVFVEDVSVPYGDSIFLINKTKLKDDLESKNAYLEVVSIEKTFPNNIVIHASEREEVYAIKIEDNTYAITDKSLKILKFCDKQYLTQTGYIAPIVVEIEYDNVDLASKGYKICDFIQETGVTDILLSTVNSFVSAGYSITSFKGFASNIKLCESGKFRSSSDSGYDLEFVKTVEISTKYGIKVSINDAYSNIYNKVAMGIATYEKIHDSHHTTGEILVYETSDRLMARYRQSD